MKKTLIAASALAVALSAVGSASAQPWGAAHGYHRNHDKREAKAYQRYVRETERYERERERAWRRGQHLPSAYRSSSYIVRNYGRYGVPAPRYGQHYYRSGNDLILGDSATGLIAQVLAGVLGGGGYYDDGRYGYR